MQENFLCFFGIFCMPGSEVISEIDLHLMRLVKLLIHDQEHIVENIDNKLSLTIRNAVDKNDKFIPDLTKDDNEWLHLKFNSNNYYFDETDGLQDNDNVLYCIGFHKTLKHITFVRIAKPEFHSAALHHLYISEDDGLDMSKVMSKTTIKDS